MDPHRRPFPTRRRSSIVHPRAAGIRRFHYRSRGSVICILVLYAISNSIRRAAYPDGHTESEEDEDRQIDRLKEKVDAGADYIVTQLFYDVDGFLRWEKKVRERGMLRGYLPILPATDEFLGINVPIIPGIMPIQTYATFMRLTKLCGTRVPVNLMADLVEIRVRDILSSWET